MPLACILGVDIGTSSSKGVLVDAATGAVLATSTIQHGVDRPQAGWVEMGADIWWDEFIQLSRVLLADRDDIDLRAVGVSGMGPCVVLADDAGTPVRPAILYGVDTRAGAQIARLTADLGAQDVIRLGGSPLTSQAAGPKIAWVADAEPEAYARARRLFMPASWLAYQLTGAYVLDHHSASQTSPLYDVEAERWHQPWWDQVAPGIEAPPLAWAGDIIGRTTAQASAATGVPVGVPVIAGTIDAWSEAVSVGAHGVGDLMLMYGTTMFLVATGTRTVRSPSMWTTVGAFPGTRNLAGGLATSGALTSWLADLTSADFPQLLSEAERSGPGSRGLLMLPYFAGERTPILDPDARGVLAGLTLDHTRGDLYRAALEATAFGVRHNVESMRAAGADIGRTVAVGGGTQGALWLQVVSDVTGLEQHVPRTTIGASYGAAFLAACATAPDGRRPDIESWNPVVRVVRPDPAHHELYNRRFGHYQRLYDLTRELVHELAAEQQETRA